VDYPVSAWTAAVDEGMDRYAWDWFWDRYSFCRNTKGVLFPWSTLISERATSLSRFDEWKCIDLYRKSLLDIFDVFNQYEESRNDLPLRNGLMTFGANTDCIGNWCFGLGKRNDDEFQLDSIAGSLKNDEILKDFFLRYCGWMLEDGNNGSEEKKAFVRKTLVSALSSTNATHAGTALVCLFRNNRNDPIIASNAFQITRDSGFSDYSRSIALLILESVSIGMENNVASTVLSDSRLHETVQFILRDPNTPPILCQIAKAIHDAPGAADCSERTVERNTAANELFSLPELPDGVVSDLARMSASTDEDEVWRDYCLQFLGSALERTDGVTDADRALARETLVEALASTNATFAGTALRALHRGDPSDPLVASNALRIARDPSYPSASRTTALLVLEECVREAPSTSSTPATLSTLAETAAAVSADPSASSLLRQTAEAVLKRIAD